MSATVLDRPPAADTVVEPMPPAVREPESRPRIRLSNAMRKGAVHHAQGYGALYGPFTGATCAMGAVLSGLLGPQWTLCEKSYDVWSVVLTQTGVDLNRYVDAHVIPVYALKERATLENIIMRLNDVHLWSRERIADWLESIGY